MANLITIGSFVVPTPSDFKSNTATIVNSARNVNGYMVGDVIRDDVAKITMSWKFISAWDWATLLQQFEPKYGGSFFRNVTFFNQTSNTLETRQMYVSDRNGSSFLLFNEDNAPSPEYIGLPSGYTDASLSLIEL